MYLEHFYGLHKRAERVGPAAVVRDCRDFLLSSQREGVKKIKGERKYSLQSTVLSEKNDLLSGILRKDLIGGQFPNKTRHLD